MTYTQRVFVGEVADTTDLAEIARARCTACGERIGTQRVADLTRRDNGELEAAVHTHCLVVSVPQERTASL